MGQTAETIQLRPLGIGEIFDRSVTLYVQNFLPFAIISAFFVVPLSIANYFAAVQQTGTWARILDQIEHGAKGSSMANTAVAPWMWVVFVFALLLAPFMYVAMAAALARIYKGEPADWRAAYGVALRHAAGILLTAVCQIVIIGTAAFAGLLILTLAFVAASLVVVFLRPLGVLVAIVAVVLTLPYLLALLLCYLATALAFDAIGIELLSFKAALSRGFARVFNRVEIGKASLICLAFVAVQFALFLVSGVVSAFIEGALHQPALQALFSGVFSLATTGFIGVLLAVYYFDVRIRREGLDLQEAIDRMQTQT